MRQNVYFLISSSTSGLQIFKNYGYGQYLSDINFFYSVEISSRYLLELQIFFVSSLNVRNYYRAQCRFPPFFVTSENVFVLIEFPFDTIRIHYVCMRICSASLPEISTKSLRGIFFRKIMPVSTLEILRHRRHSFL